MKHQLMVVAFVLLALSGVAPAQAEKQAKTPEELILDCYYDAASDLIQTPYSNEVVAQKALDLCRPTVEKLSRAEMVRQNFSPDAIDTKLPLIVRTVEDKLRADLIDDIARIRAASDD